jgi:hypothetical protein
MSIAKLYILTHGQGSAYEQYPVLIDPKNVPEAFTDERDAFYKELAKSLGIELLPGDEPPADPTDFDDFALTGPIAVGDIPTFGKALRELTLDVPTYNGRLYPNEVANDTKPEWGEPEKSILLLESDGVRIVLGSKDIDDYDVPDVQIERQPAGWAIFIHPIGGYDAVGYFYILDDGRTFFDKEYWADDEDEGFRLIEINEKLEDVVPELASHDTLPPKEAPKPGT